MRERPFRILFVCTGNTCRSPLAERIAARELKQRGWDEEVQVGSAGILALDGQPASEGSLQVAREAGLALEDHRSRLLTEELAREADLILGMSEGHVTQVATLTEGVAVALLGDFARDSVGVGPAVPDPFGGPVEVYRETLRTLETLVPEALDRLPRPLDVGDGR
ncbi:MAG: low molecular weight protein arginine phosphatase [Gemmatimonadota bacterium]